MTMLEAFTMIAMYFQPNEATEYQYTFQMATSITVEKRSLASG